MDCEEIFAEFDQKCIGLELQTTPLKSPHETVSRVLFDSAYLHISCKNRQPKAQSALTGQLPLATFKQKHTDDL